MNAAFALATRMTESFSKYGMCVAMSGVEGGGLVTGLPVHNFYTDEGDTAMKCPTEVPITDRREKELADLGFAPLVHCKDTDYAAFFSVQSAQKPKVYDSDSANANARLSAQLPYIMAVSRFAHYLKAMMRDKIGSFMSRTEAELFLNRWITKYVVPDDTASPSTKARAPCARRASTSVKCRASRASTVPSPFCGRTFSSTNLPSPCGWWRTCQRRQSTTSIR
jgi:type VI secretion system protein ImpC